MAKKGKINCQFLLCLNLRFRNLPLPLSLTLLLSIPLSGLVPVHQNVMNQMTKRLHKVIAINGAWSHSSVFL
jgi:hypothetical protein